jgi:hypothetical protein
VRRLYGAGPVHLLAGVAGLALAGFGLAQALDVLGDPFDFALWLAGSIVAHDLLLFPLYSALGRAAQGVVAGADPSRLRIAALNHVRVPALLSGLAFLVWFPLVLGLDPSLFERTAGTSNDVYLERWLLLTAALFGGSAVLLAARAHRLR